MKNELKQKLAEIKVKENLLSDKESLVAEQYNQAWLRHMKDKKIPANVIRVCNCDAFWVGKQHNILVEYKYDIDMENPVERAKVLAQAIAYYRAISEKGKTKNASVVFVADVNECFALHVNYINKFVNLPGVKWVAPNKMGDDPVLVGAIVADGEIHEKSIVFNTTDPDFSEERIFGTIDGIAEGLARIVPITEATVKMGFEHFSTRIVDKSKYAGKANDLVGMYFEFIKKEADCFVRGNKLYFSQYSPIQVNADKANQFRSRFGAFSENDKRELERMYDTLVSDAERRMNGQFFTPKVWVDEAHRRMAKILGENWESTVPTWDNCCGTKSLTRDYEHGELYLSTLEQAELNASEKLSAEARETFVFDFLNTDMEKLPDSLKKAMKTCGEQNKPFAFLINPPYGQATNRKGIETKDGISFTAALEDMKKHDMGKAGRELTVQFLWRIIELVKKYKMKNVTLGLFSNPAWMTGDSFETFRKEWNKYAEFKDGFAFRSEEFEGVKPGWAINFSVWSISADKKNNHNHVFPCDILENDQDGMELSNVGKHEYCNLDGKELASSWVRGELPKTKKTFATVDGIKIIDGSDSRCRGMWCEGSLGYLYCNGNSVKSNSQETGLFSMAFKAANGFNLLPENIDRAVSLFAARRLVEDNVWNHQDVYAVPNTNHQKYAEWNSDAYVLSMFESKSYQTSICGDCNGKHYDFVNQFHPFTKSETYDLCGIEKKTNFQDESRWCKANGKFVNLSHEAAEVMEAYRTCIRNSAPARREFHKQHPELQLNRWDAGYRQLKVLFAEACPDDFKVLKEKVKNLKSKMLPLVYELGFLRG